MRPSPSRRPRHRLSGRARLGTSARRTVAVARGTTVLGLAAALASGLDPPADPVRAPGAPGPAAVAAAGGPSDVLRGVHADAERWTGLARAHAEQDVRESRALAAAALAAATGLDPVRIAPEPPAALGDLDDAVADLRAVAAALATTAGRPPVVLDRAVVTTASPLVTGTPETPTPRTGAPRPAGVARTVPARLAAAAEVREAAAAVFRLSLAVERQAPRTVADASAPDTTGLDALERSAAAATRAADLLGAGVPVAPGSAEATPGLLRPDGTADPAVLCPVPFAPGALLRCDAVADLVRLDEVFRAEHGSHLPVGDTYRTYEQQVALKAAKGGLAATPGASHHGWGVAVDFRGFGGVGDFDQPLYRWMVAHAPAFGWVHPAGMGPDGAGPQEPWHWEYAGTGERAGTG